SEDPCLADFTIVFDGNDTATRAGKSERYDLRELPVLRRSWSGEDFDDHECGAASNPQHRDAKISGQRARFSRHPESGRAEAVEGRGRRIADRAGTALRRPIDVPRGSDLSSRKIHRDRREHRRRTKIVKSVPEKSQAASVRLAGQRFRVRIIASPGPALPSALGP